MGYRHVLVISSDLLNKYLSIVILCPLTSKIENYKDNVGLEPSPENGLQSRSEVMTIYIRSIFRDLLVSKIGSVWMIY